jgi:hypothetical protein
MQVIFNKTVQFYTKNGVSVQFIYTTESIQAGPSWSVKQKIKQSHYRPGQTLRVPGGWGSQIYRQSAHEGDKAVSPTHRPPLSPRKYSWYSVLLQAEWTTRPQCDLKIPVTPSGIEPATFRLITQCLYQLRHCVSPFMACTVLNLLNRGTHVWFQTSSVKCIFVNTY